VYIGITKSQCVNLLLCHPHTHEVTGSKPVPPTIRKSNGDAGFGLRPSAFIPHAAEPIWSRGILVYEERIPRALAVENVKGSLAKLPLTQLDFIKSLHSSRILKSNTSVRHMKGGLDAIL